MQEDLLNRLQYAYVVNKYTGGVYQISSISEEDLSNILDEFVNWMEQFEIIDGKKRDEILKCIHTGKTTEGE